MRKFLMLILILLLCVAVFVYLNRHVIVEQMIEKTLSENLPDSILIDDVKIDINKGKAEVIGLKVLNPEGFREDHCLTIDRLVCMFDLSSEGIFEGIDIQTIKINGLEVFIERGADKQINLIEAGERFQPETEVIVDQNRKSVIDENKLIRDFLENKGMLDEDGNFDVSGKINVTDTINIKNGTITYYDLSTGRIPFSVSIDDIQGDLIIKTFNSFSDILLVRSYGTGTLNGYHDQTLKWNTTFYPETAKLTMSNNIEAMNVDISTFLPYIDSYLPITISKGRLSGNLVFDFDNGNIGSMCSLKLNDLDFKAKQQGGGVSFWEEGVDDIVRYLRTSPDEIFFDFKVKGDLENPRFYPGPVVKAALQRMFMEKIQYMIGGEDEGGQADSDKRSVQEGMVSDQQGERSDIDTVVGILQGLLN